MAKTIKMTVTITPETKSKGVKNAKATLGTSNISGYISFLINEADKKVLK